MSSIWDSLKLSKAAKSSISAVWLDVANAYGSILRKLIFFALRRYGIPEKWIDLVITYYRGLWSKSFYPTAQVGISILREFLSVVLLLFCSFRVLTLLLSTFVMKRII